MAAKIKKTFGPYSEPLIIAHRNTPGGCLLIWGAAADMQNVDLTGCNIYTLPAGTVCRMRHVRRKNGKCRQRFLQIFSNEVKEPAPQDPLPPPPTQLCLCEDGEKSCPVGTIPDCADSSVCIEITLH